MFECVHWQYWIIYAICPMPRLRTCIRKYASGNKDFCLLCFRTFCIFTNCVHEPNASNIFDHIIVWIIIISTFNMCGSLKSTSYHIQWKLIESNRRNNNGNGSRKEWSICSSFKVNKNDFVTFGSYFNTEAIIRYSESRPTFKPKPIEWCNSTPSRFVWFWKFAKVRNLRTNFHSNG